MLVCQISFAMSLRQDMFVGAGFGLSSSDILHFVHMLLIGNIALTHLIGNLAFYASDITKRFILCSVMILNFQCCNIYARVNSTVQQMCNCYLN